jgi:hypothetical protein
MERAVFKFCYSLECVSLPDSLMLFGGCAFEGCVSLAPVLVPPNAQAMSKLKGPARFVRNAKQSQTDLIRQAIAAAVDAKERARASGVAWASPAQAVLHA